MFSLWIIVSAAFTTLLSYLSDNSLLSSSSESAIVATAFSSLSTYLQSYFKFLIMDSALEIKLYFSLIFSL